jgi:hypothetical protein
MVQTSVVLKVTVVEFFTTKPVTGPKTLSTNEFEMLNDWLSFKVISKTVPLFYGFFNIIETSKLDTLPTLLGESAPKIYPILPGFSTATFLSPLDAIIPPYPSSKFTLYLSFIPNFSS